MLQCKRDAASFCLSPQPPPPPAAATTITVAVNRRPRVTRDVLPHGVVAVVDAALAAAVAETMPATPAATAAVPTRRNGG